MVDIHPEQASTSHAEAAFEFSLALGFHLSERFVSGGSSFRDGWRLRYLGQGITVTVQYYDAQFEVLFESAHTRTDYLFIDRERYGRRSGYHGNMFPPQKLGPVVDRIALDIREHYCPLLAGDAAEWAQVERLINAPRAKSRLP